MSKQADRKEEQNRYNQLHSVECNIQITFKVSPFHSNESQALKTMSKIDNKKVLLLLIGPFRYEYNSLHRGV